MWDAGVYRPGGLTEQGVWGSPRAVHVLWEAWQACRLVDARRVGLSFLLIGLLDGLLDGLLPYFSLYFIFAGHSLDGLSKVAKQLVIGILIYEMIVGYPPFVDEDPPEAHRANHLQPLRMGIYQKILAQSLG